jgi:hypothetical protein
MKKTTNGLTLALLVEACAGGPRPYAPVMAQPLADTSAFQVSLETCHARIDQPNAALSGAATAAEGAATTYVVGGVALAAGASSGGTLAAAAAAAGPAMVVALPISLYMYSRGRRARQERRIQQAMSACMAEQGYQVVEWRRVDEAPRE